MVDSVFDGRNRSNDTLVICDFLLRVKRNIEVNLWEVISCFLYTLAPYVKLVLRLTRMRTRLSLRSTSVMASLLERDMVYVKSPSYSSFRGGKRSESEVS